MLLNKGEKLHVIVRRNFENDLRRRFVGEVRKSTDLTAIFEGYAFVFNPFSNQFLKKPEKQVIIISLVDSGLIINLIPSNVNLEDLYYQKNPENRHVLTDNKSFISDINEFSELV